MYEDTDDAPMSAICGIGEHEGCMVWACVCHCHDQDHLAEVIPFPQGWRA